MTAVLSVSRRLCIWPCEWTLLSVYYLSTIIDCDISNAQYHSCEIIQQVIGKVCCHGVHNLIIICSCRAKEWPRLAEKNCWDVHEPKTWTKSEILSRFNCWHQIQSTYLENHRNAFTANVSRGSMHVLSFWAQVSTSMCFSMCFWASCPASVECKKKPVWFENDCLK